eukprot:scaffold27675_cov85-Phaeocystis_antarctica.AAC.2
MRRGEPLRVGSALYHGKSVEAAGASSSGSPAWHTLSNGAGILVTLGGSQPAAIDACQLQCVCSSPLKLKKNHPAASSNAETLCAASTGSYAASLSHGLLTAHWPLAGALVPVPCGPKAMPMDGPAMPVTYG